MKSTMGGSVMRTKPVIRTSTTSTPDQDMMGYGFFGDVWDGVKKGFNWVKDNQVISKVTGIIPDSRARVLSGVLGSVGLGKKKRKKRTASKGMTGGGTVIRV
jgi:hypothetical protein